MNDCGSAVVRCGIVGSDGHQSSCVDRRAGRECTCLDVREGTVLRIMTDTLERACRNARGRDE